MVQWSTKDAASSSALSLPCSAGRQLVLLCCSVFSQLRVTHPPTAMLRWGGAGCSISVFLHQGADPFQPSLESLSSLSTVSCKSFHALQKANMWQRGTMVGRWGGLVDRGHVLHASPLEQEWSFLSQGGNHQFAAVSVKEAASPAASGCQHTGCRERYPEGQQSPMFPASKGLLSTPSKR